MRHFAQVRGKHIIKPVNFPCLTATPLTQQSLSTHSTTRFHPETHSLRHHPQPAQLNKIKTQTGKHQLHTNPRQRSHQHMTRPKNPFNHRERPFPRTPFPANPPVPELISDTQRMTPRRTLHGGIPSTRHSTLITLIPVHHLTPPG